MTAHSGRGQGDQPLYEGVVLPANGDPWTPEQQRQADSSHTQPSAGQPWGQPWGPESQAAMTSWDQSEPSLPPPPQSPPPPPPQQPPFIPPQQHSAAANAEEAGPGAGGSGGGVQPPPGFPPADLPPASAQPPHQAGADLPPVQQPQPPHTPFPPAPHHGRTFDGNAQLPPQQPSVGPPFAQEPGPGQTFPPQGVSPAMPAPSAAATASEPDATQFLPPATGAPHPDRYQAAQAPPATDADATQMLPPQTGRPPVPDAESTTQLRTPLPPEAPAGSGPGSRQQPPAGFESLFRSEPASDPGGTGATQELPLFDEAAARQRNGETGGLGKSGAPAGGYWHGPAPAGPQSGQWEPQGRAARRNAERSAVSRLSPALLIAVGVAVVAGVGMAAGAALSGGGDEDGKAESKSSAAPASENSAGADPAEAQAKELDKLLADSNNSRASVIRSVENIKSCKKLGRAAGDLRAAADQRNNLIKRLGELETGKIPADAKLKSALTRAWKASASADSHYAAWADQVGGKKGCHKGKARTTAHTGQGARASGQATAAKKKAAALWNPTAKKYGLKERRVVQL